MNNCYRTIFLTVALSLFSFKQQALAFENNKYDELEAIEINLQKESFDLDNDLNNLARAKYHLIGGDLKLAKFYLSHIDDKKSKVFVIKNRYLAVINFIDGQFSKSINYLKDPRFSESSSFEQVCLLKIINYMAINDIETLKKEKDACIFHAQKTSKNNAYWLDTMIKLKLNDQAGFKKSLLTDVQYTLTDDEMSKLWLKTGLYLNKEKDLLNLLSLLPESSYQSKRLREIVAFMYLRSNSSQDKIKALSFIDDIDSVNAENIKGNINLQNKEYELAFGHFRLALQKKQDSYNSLERAIPLAWILNQWNDGLSMLENNTNKGLDPRNKKATRIAFLVRQKNFIEASKEIILLKIDFKNELPLEVKIMEAYVGLMLDEKDKKYDQRKIEDASESACRSFDGMSCWTSLQYIHRKNLGSLIKRDEYIFQDKEMTLDSLKASKAITPLKETITVDQRDIEELDSADIQLMKKINK